MNLLREGLRSRVIQTSLVAHHKEVAVHPTTDSARVDQVVASLAERLGTMTHTLATWVQADPHDLAAIEQHVLRIVKEFGATLLARLTSLLVPVQPLPTVPCPCGRLARYQRQRPATVTTRLGPITLTRPYYLCATCGHGQYPLDAQLQLCAGSRSAGLDELLALLGATQDSFAEAATVLDRLTLVQVSPNSVRAATEHLGAVLCADQAQHAAAAQQGVTHPSATAPAAQRLYITMDGVLAHLHDRGWREVKVGCCYQTHARPERQRPERVEIRAHSLSYVTALTEAEPFGWQLWQEAARRGVVVAEEVVVLGDGAHWIWNLADTHFPQATQILDWYHASAYVWDAATAIWGETGSERAAWAHQQLDALWAGQVEAVLAELEQRRAHGAGVLQALSYYTTHRNRMDYAAYRARGLQIGSGSVESACKQLVSARLKQAGMIGDAPGAEAVATVRAWLKSERWAEAMALRPARVRSYQRQRGGRERAIAEAACGAERAGATEQGPSRGGLPADVLARVRAELAHDGERHPWRNAWSVKRQQEQHGGPAPGATPALAA